jgi:hypothetical protein
MRKVTNLSERAGFLQPADAKQQVALFNRVFNIYCKATRPQHEEKDFMSAETTTGEAELAVEREIFGSAA